VTSDLSVSTPEGVRPQAGRRSPSLRASSQMLCICSLAHGGSRSERGGGLRHDRPAAAGARGFPQLAFDRAGAGEDAAVEGVELASGRKEDEAAGHADRDAHRAAVELDCETLALH